MPAPANFNAELSAGTLLGKLWTGRDVTGKGGQHGHAANVAQTQEPTDAERFAAFANNNQAAFDAFQVNPVQMRYQQLQRDTRINARTAGQLSAGVAGVDNGAAGDARQVSRSDFVALVGLETTQCCEPSDKEKQKRLQRPLNQQRHRHKSKGLAMVETIVDSAASDNLGPAEEVARLGQNVVELDGPSITTADANGPTLKVVSKADFNGKVATEKGTYKQIMAEFKGVQGMDKFLWSVPNLYRADAEVRFARPEKGGSKIRLKDSEEWIPMEFVNDKYFRVKIDMDPVTKLSLRQMQEQNFYTHCLAAHLDNKILDQTARNNLVRNFVWNAGVSFGTDETCLKVKGQMGPMPKEKQWRPAKVGAVTYMDLARIDKDFGKRSYCRWMLTTGDAAGNFKRRYYLRSTAQLHLWVRKHQFCAEQRMGICACPRGQ